MKAAERIETRRLILRHFAREDWRDLQEIAISKEQDDFSACDFAWPTDAEGVQAACAYFAADAANWAVALKETGKVICFVRQNGIEAGQEMDIGHLVNREYAGQGYEEIGEYFLSMLTGIDMQRVATMGIHDSMQDMIVCLIGTVALLPSTSRYFRRGVPGIFMRPFDEFLHKNAIFTSHLRDA